MFTLNIRATDTSAARCTLNHCAVLPMVERLIRALLSQRRQAHHTISGRARPMRAADHSRRRHLMNCPFHVGAVAGLALGTVMSVAMAGPVRSVGAMTFADADTVVIADWRAGEVHAVQLAPTANATARPFNLKNVSTPIARALGTQPDKLRFEDMAFRPGAELAYITLSIDRGAGVPAPALVSVDAAGKVAVVDLARTRRTSAEIKSRPAADQRF